MATLSVPAGEGRPAAICVGALVVDWVVVGVTAGDVVVEVTTGLVATVGDVVFCVVLQELIRSMVMDVTIRIKQLITAQPFLFISSLLFVFYDLIIWMNSQLAFSFA